MQDQYGSQAALSYPGLAMVDAAVLHRSSFLGGNEKQSMLMLDLLY